MSNLLVSGPHIKYIVTCNHTQKAPDNVLSKFMTVLSCIHSHRGPHAACGPRVGHPCREETTLSLIWDSSPSRLTAVSSASARVFVLIFLFLPQKHGKCLVSVFGHEVKTYLGLWQRRASCNLRNGTAVDHHLLSVLGLQFS